ncbi:hypothetical protein Lgor_0375 [Fluoribacter gormanii]|uniref:Uncharacterized protein n=1 Tax=Fluoribacter gormanii TaxID=464 RepID=A0A377GL61_9GAMM|nr:hypothetical protein Lgor_0375 [Fluoribacter gormanii]SIR62299.1 hypothetical protein SAMN05421777_11746 [Fluoribacter gormanii]STO25313.1 Uncharacterised protein [Fluoribacter gormanii]
MRDKTAFFNMASLNSLYEKLPPSMIKRIAEQLTKFENWRLLSHKDSNEADYQCSKKLQKN